MSTTRGRVTPKATCDQCGREREALPGVFSIIEGRRICNWHPHFITPERLDAQPYLTFQAKPIKDSRPFDPRPSYQLAEDQLCAFLEEHYQFGAINVAASFGPSAAVSSSGRTSSAYSAAWAGIYFYALMTENRRPYGMVARARAGLRTVADWLVSHQEAGPAITTGMGLLIGDTIANDSSQPEWGGYNRDQSPFNSAIVSVTSTQGDFKTLSSAAAGIALLRAYQTFGAQSYLLAARACAWFVRTMQCGDLLPVRFSASDAAGANRKHWGTWAHQMIGGSIYQMDHLYQPQSLLCLQFLTLYKAVVGDEVIGSAVTGFNSPTGAAQVLSGSRAALVSACIAEARAFWENAQADSVLGSPVLGFSAATPADGFASYSLNNSFNATIGVGTGSWVWTGAGGTFSATGPYIAGGNWAMGLAALYAADGASPFVLSVFDWLMGFSSNPATELPTKYDDRLLLSGRLGKYVPTTAIAFQLQVRNSVSLAFTVTTNGAIPGYDFGATGLLAPLLSSRQQAGFKEFKDALDQPRPFTVDGGRTMYLGPLGQAGFSYQPWLSIATAGVTTLRRQLPARAAQAGLAYRQAPQNFLGRGVVQ